MSAHALVVEDDPTILQLVSLTLESRGYTVDQALDGTSGLDAARARRPDVVLLDIGLPDIDGLTVLSRLKDDAALREVPVVMVTAWNEPGTIRLAMDRGARDYVCKPFDLDDLGARVDRATAGGRAPLEVTNDPVTALPNRPHMDVALERQATAARRTGRAFSLVLADLDHFAQLNEEHGTEAGDDLLRAIAKRFRQRAGVSDVIVRWSGDRIAVLVPGADAEAAAGRAEALRAALAEAPLDTPTVALTVTASFGVAEFLPHEHADETIARAEAAVRSAKDEDGRNAVRTAAAPAAAPAPAPAPATARPAAAG